MKKIVRKWEVWTRVCSVEIRTLVLYLNATCFNNERVEKPPKFPFQLTITGQCTHPPTLGERNKSPILKLDEAFVTYLVLLVMSATEDTFI